MSGHPYILGSGDAELDRLASQHEIWQASTAQLWRDAGFGPGEHILDLGCGPGFTSFELAELVGPAGRIIAMDSSERFMQELTSWCRERGVSNLDARLGDAYHINVDRNSLDGVFIRWLLCFLPDTEQIVKAAADALKPGGRIVVMDYFNYLGINCFPQSAIFTRVFGEIYESFADSGGNLDVGDKLPGLMQSAGLEVTHIHPIIRAARPGDAIWRWVRAFQKIYLAQLVDKGYLSKADIAENDRHWHERAANPASFFLSPPMLSVIARKPE